MVVNEILLFDNSLSIQIDDEYFDGSLLRQVPDNQYLFLSRTTLDCFIVELLEIDKELNIADLVKEIGISSQDEILTIPNSDEITFLRVNSKRSESLCFGLIRKSNLNLDILITKKSERKSDKDFDELKALTKSLKILDTSLFKV